jgi:hypothetical protein
MLTVALGIVVTLAPPAYAARGCGGVTLDLTFDEPASQYAITSDGAGTYFGAAGMDCSGKMSSLFGNRAIHMELTGPTNPAYPRIAATVFGNLGIWGFPFDTIGAVSAERIQFNFLYGGNRYFLQMGAAFSGSGTSTGTLRKVDGITWTAEAAASDIARLVRCPAKGKCDLNTAPVVGFYFVPFKITLTTVP